MNIDPIPPMPKPIPPMPKPIALLTVKQITKRFAMPHHFLSRNRPVLQALRGVDLEVHKGEVFCVVGESGCGKTTIGRVIMGLIKPNHGEIIFQGNRIDNLNEDNRRSYRQKMQMVFQNPYASLNPRMTIEQTLAEPLKILKIALSKDVIKDKIDQTLLSVGADPLWGRRLPHEFSGGQRQRISIARALITDPEFIVADEPISALDVSIQAQILNLMSEQRERRGLTYFFITHDLSVVQHFADKVAVMYLGAVVETAKVEDIFANPKHPYTRLLLSAIPSLKGNSFKSNHQIGELPNPINPPSGCAFRTRCPLANKRCSDETPVLIGEANHHKTACHAVQEGRTG